MAKILLLDVLDVLEGCVGNIHVVVLDEVEEELLVCWTPLLCFWLGQHWGWGVPVWRFVCCGCGGAGGLWHWLW
jgi:hypothetical protein